MITCVNNLPILPISRAKYELELDKKNPKVFWLDQLKTLLKRMILQLYRNRVRIEHIHCITKCQMIYIVIQKRFANSRKLDSDLKKKVI